jgi:serine/threonine protein kinase
MALNSIGRFKVVKKLGSGNQGTVYLCDDPELERSVAIKLLDKAVLGSQEAAAAFAREARSMSKIQHPNIVSIYEAGRHQGVPFLVFEYVQGRLVSAFRNGSEPDVPAVLEVFQGMLEGMDRAHRQGIVHRDLKPSNIIIDQDGVPKIMDFGIARILSGGRDRDTQLIGSPRYMAPEYIERGEVGTQVDVFALGLILDEMLTGMPVFQAGTQQAVLDAIVNDPVSAPSVHNPAVDERLDRIVLKALEKDPSTRYADAGDFLQALRAYRDRYAESGGGSVANSGKGTLDFLLRRMQRKSDFPALSQSIRTINAMASTSDQDVNDMAKVIVQDFALTNKILKVVNSAYFGHFAGKISTISRAVVVLGMQPIRSLAASLILFEHLSDKTQAEELRALTSTALYGAVLAGHTAARMDSENREEHFLSAMLQNLGRILVAYYLRDESREIKRLEAQGVDPAKAQKTVLGIELEELGMGIAREWNFPDEIIRTLRALPRDQEVKPPKTLEERRRTLSSFANETARWVGGPGGSNGGERRALLARFGDALGIDGKGMNELLSTATKEFVKLVKHASTHTRGDPFVRRLQARLEGRDTGEIQDAAADGLPGEAAARQIMEEMQVQTGDSEALLGEAVQEITNLLLNQPNLPELCNMVLETMFRSMSFHRVILCLKDRPGRNMVAKLGFGADVERYLKEFRFSMTWQPDVFHAALKKGADLYIADAADPKIRGDLPAWYLNLSDAASFLVLSLSVRNRPLGLIYADHPLKDGVQINAKTLNLLKTLRNQLALGFRERM